MRHTRSLLSLSLNLTKHPKGWYSPEEYISLSPGPRLELDLDCKVIQAEIEPTTLSRRSSMYAGACGGGGGARGYKKNYYVVLLMVK